MRSGSPASPSRPGCGFCMPSLWLGGRCPSGSSPNSSGSASPRARTTYAGLRTSGSSCCARNAPPPSSRSTPTAAPDSRTPPTLSWGCSLRARAARPTCPPTSPSAPSSPATGLRYGGSTPRASPRATPPSRPRSRTAANSTAPGYPITAGSPNSMGRSSAGPRCAPRLTELAQALARADDAEAAPLVQRDAGLVLGEDARLERPDPGALGRFDQCPQEASADALAASVLGHVDHLLRDAAVDVAAW